MGIYSGRGLFEADFELKPGLGALKKRRYF